jgi:hypothetical protein
LLKKPQHERQFIEDRRDTHPVRLTWAMLKVSSAASMLGAAIERKTVNAWMLGTIRQDRESHCRWCSPCAMPQPSGQ